jgi:hypothetical protein
LCKQVVVAVVKRDEAGCAELRTELAIPFLNSWVVVLDGKGETLASWIGDAAGHGCKKNSVDQFPRNLVRLVRKSLERSETVEELERRWKSRQHDTELFERLASRLAEMHAYDRVRQLCEEAAASPELSGPQRDGFRIRAFIARASDHAERLSTRKARAHFVREGEKLLVELAGHPKAAGLVGVLFARGYAHTFDVPAHSARAIARLERACREAADGAALKERIRELVARREKWIEVTSESLRRTEGASAKSFLAATLGDAQAAIELCSQPPYKEYPEYREWLRQARRKVERIATAPGRASTEV